MSDQFMFGPALLVAPVTKAGGTSRTVYLPPGSSWYDFWTGTSLQGGSTVSTPAALDKIPLYVRAGSIIPMGPELQYTGEKPEDPIELRIYPGANGTFQLFEDDGLTYACEKASYVTIAVHWNDATHVLTLEERKGSFPAMLKERSFLLVMVGRNHGGGEGLTATPDRTVRYDGTRQTVELPLR